MSTGTGTGDSNNANRHNVDRAQPAGRGSVADGERAGGMYAFAAWGRQRKTRLDGESVEGSGSCSGLDSGSGGNAAGSGVATDSKNIAVHAQTGPAVDLIASTMRRVRQADASASRHAARDSGWGWDDVSVSVPMLAGFGAVALALVVMMAMASWDGPGPGSGHGHGPSRVTGISTPGLNLTIGGRHQRIQFQVRSSVTLEPEVPTTPLLQVARYEALFTSPDPAAIESR